MDELKRFVERGQAAQRAVDNVVALESGRRRRQMRAPIHTAQTKPVELDAETDALLQRIALMFSNPAAYLYRMGRESMPKRTRAPKGRITCKRCGRHYARNASGKIRAHKGCP